MAKWSPRGVMTLLLGLWVALAPAVFAIPATAASVQTTMSDDAGPGGCDACPEGDAARGICQLMCLNAALFATIAEPGGLAANIDPGHRPDPLLALLGRLSTPDPAPPKYVSLQ